MRFCKPRHVAATIGLSIAVCLIASPARAGVIDDAVVFYDFEGSGQTVSDQSGTTAIALTLGADNTPAADDPPENRASLVMA